MSPQTNYSQDMSPAVAGLQVDGRLGSHYVSPAAEEVVPFGLAVVRKSDDFNVGRLPGANQVVVTEDAGTYTAGNIVVTINGQTITEAFDTDKATTLGNLATTLAALGFVTSAVYSAPTLTIVGTADVYLAVAVDVSGITGTMTISGYAHSSTDPVLGLSTREVKSYGDARNRANDTAVCTLGGDALAANDKITGTVNGVAIATVTYATSEAVTLQLLVDEILKNSGVAGCSLSGRVVTITNNPGLEIQVALTVTDDALVSEAPAFTYAYSKQSTGVTLLEVAYLPTETISTCRRGALYVLCEEQVSLGDTPFVRVATGTGSQRGAFRNDADSGSCQDMSATFGFIGDAVQDPDGNWIAPVEINLP